MAPVSPMACIDSRRFRQDADDPGIALSALIGVERGWAGPDRNFTAKNHRGIDRSRERRYSVSAFS